jgi:hypothetical protein
VLPSTGATIVAVSEGTVDVSVGAGVTVRVSVWLVCVSCAELAEGEGSGVAEGVGEGSGLLDGLGVGVALSEGVGSGVAVTVSLGEGEGDGSTGVGLEGSVTTPL